MVRQSGVDRSIITTGWYTDPTMIGTSSPLDGTPGQHQWLHHHCLMVRRAGINWLHHHRWMVRRTGIDGRLITTGRYAKPTSMDVSSPLDGTPGRRRWTHHHNRIVRRIGSNGALSLPNDTSIWWW
jgi:hypothetical protein